MSEVAETGTSLWPVIALAIYWTYVLFRDERRQHNGRNGSNGHGGLFGPGARPPRPALADRLFLKPSLSAAAARAVFNGDRFLADARNAYEFILHKYAAGDIRELAELLDPAVLEAFAREIERRMTEGKRIELSLVALKAAEIVDMDFDDVTATVRVRFEAEIFISGGEDAAKDRAPDAPWLLNAVDLWTFQKTHGSRSPVWTLVATETP